MYLCSRVKEIVGVLGHHLNLIYQLFASICFVNRFYTCTYDEEELCRYKYICFEIDICAYVWAYMYDFMYVNIYEIEQRAIISCCR